MIRRRQFLAAAAATAASGCVRFLPPERDAPAGDPFTLGVASGDADHQGVVLWTRLAPSPFNDRVLAHPLEVRWVVARDEKLARRVQKGSRWALPEHAHSVHVELDGLEPDREYFYRFECAGFRSRVGRTRTLPRPGTDPGRCTLAVTTCQNWSDGYFTAYRDIVERDPRLIVHTGDYIYESGRGSVRRDPIPEAITLSDYRTMYAHYKLDPDLQAAHARIPWLAIWDDHEVVNDWGPRHRFPSRPTRVLSFDEYLDRKRAAIKAYFEHMPLRLSARVLAGGPRMHRRAAIGDLIELSLLDVRSYRDPPVCELDERKHFEPCDAGFDPSRTLLGAAQEQWLGEGFGAGCCVWNGLVQATVMAPYDLEPGPGLRFEADGWETYPANRQRILDMIAEKRVDNTISLGGNIHAFYSGTVHANPNDVDSKLLLHEFVSTSISASGGGDERWLDITGRASENPSMRWFENRRRGYLWCDVDRARWRTEFRAVDDVTKPDSGAATIHEMVVEAVPGSPRAGRRLA